MCTCASISPGSRVASPRSMTSAPSGIEAFAPRAVMRSPATITRPGVDNEALLPSYSRAALSTVTFAVVAAQRTGRARASMRHCIDDQMKPWVTISKAGPLVLQQRDDELVVRSAGVELMSSRRRDSEEALAAHARGACRVLV